MTKDEYAYARAELINLIAKQPNLFQAAPATEQGGRHLAGAYWGFIETLAELKTKKGPND
ncbi:MULTISPECIES: hypothetical protein [Bordetella]|uniref:Uncharacterized protein n=1 Tax=Bordetella genomosp. 2 TaxID=1983456 RepID=A0A261W1Y8_9BORD|nr:hypothetical protein [Bordetella genomosp. 2]OZI79890.1 hypothetical protein CAL24_08230 [Bordetella genomosp. 2]